MYRGSKKVPSYSAVIYINIYIYLFIYLLIYIYIFTYLYIERERDFFIEHWTLILFPKPVFANSILGV